MQIPNHYVIQIKKTIDKNLSLITIIDFVFAKNAKSQITVAKNGQGPKKEIRQSSS